MAATAMKVSVALTNFSWSGGPTEYGEQLISLANRLDRSAVDTLWVADQLLQADPDSSMDEPVLEAYTSLGFLACATTRIRLGTMVTAATYRAPALLIKAVTTLDVLAGGRAWLGIGIGAGHFPQEAQALGLDVPAVGERYSRMVDLLQLAARMWDGDQAPFHGNHVRAERPICSPRPVGHRRLPILIGGTGERRTLRLVAEYANACNLFDIPDGGRSLRRQLDVLARHCADVGRPYDEVETTVTTVLQPNESPDRVVDRCRALNDLGVQHAVFLTRGRPWSHEDVDTIQSCAYKLASQRGGA
jgi:alkanesulfonate monooxygenase SsuD/methylene tetrahydromethanopterin reductase-like flavin-dependent oxidoreductase (luciferase family)